MKQSFAFIVALLWAVSAFSQDFIILRNGDMIQSKVQEISDSEIRYKKFSNQGGPMYVVKVSEVLAINFENGDKEVFDKPAAVPAEPVAAAASAVEIGLPDDEYNRWLIQSVNDWHFESEKEAGNKPKKAVTGYCKLSVADDSQIANKDVEIDFISGCYRPYNNNWNNPMVPNDCILGSINNYIKFIIKNRTDKTIYIDLGNTFFSRGTVSAPLYVPSATSETVGRGTGASVNLGGVANAAGLGGTAVGALANAVNVGGGKTSSSTTTTYSQRIIAVAPNSSQVLDPQIIFLLDAQLQFPVFTINTYSDRTATTYNGSVVLSNQLLNWSKVDSPVKLGFFLTYSFDESIQSKANVKASLHLSEMVGVRNDDVSKPNEAKLFFLTKVN